MQNKINRGQLFKEPPSFISRLKALKQLVRAKCVRYPLTLQAECSGHTAFFLLFLFSSIFQIRLLFTQKGLSYGLKFNMRFQHCHQHFHLPSLLFCSMNYRLFVSCSYNCTFVILWQPQFQYSFIIL